MTNGNGLSTSLSNKYMNKVQMHLPQKPRAKFTTNDGKIIGTLRVNKPNWLYGINKKEETFASRKFLL